MTSAECTSQTWHPHLSNQLLPAAATRVCPAHPENPDSTQRCRAPSISILSLSLLCSVSVCQSLAGLTWRARCTTSYDPDVTANPSSTHDTAAPKTSSGQTQTKTRIYTERERQHSAAERLLTVQIQVVNVVMLSEPFYHPQVQKHQTVKEEKELPAFTYRRGLHHSYELA